MIKNKDNSFLVKIVLVLLIIYLLYILGSLWGGVYDKIVAIIYPFAIGFILAYAFHPFLKFMQKKGIHKTISIIIICLIIVSFTAFILINIVPVFTTQLQETVLISLTFIILTRLHTLIILKMAIQLITIVLQFLILHLITIM